jgi:hypothetical protein
MKGSDHEQINLTQKGSFRIKSPTMRRVNQEIRRYIEVKKRVGHNDVWDVVLLQPRNRCDSLCKVVGEPRN